MKYTINKRVEILFDYATGHYMIVAGDDGCCLGWLTDSGLVRLCDRTEGDSTDTTGIVPR